MTPVLLKQSVWSNSGWPHRLGRSRTPGFQPGNRGSNPLGAIAEMVNRLNSHTGYDCFKYYSAVNNALDAGGVFSTLFEFYDMTEYI